MRKYLKIIFIIILIIPIISAAFAETSNNELFYPSEVLELINQERAKYNIASLIEDQDLMSAAIIRSSEISTLFSHTRPDGNRGLSVSSKVYGENLGAGNSTPKDIVKEWMKSTQGHREAILNSSYKTVGIAYLYNESDVGGYKYYWVVLFGIQSKSFVLNNKTPQNTTTSNTPTNSITPQNTPTQNISLPKIANLKKLKITNNKISFNWSKQSAATGYQVFKYNSKTKNFELLKTLIGNKNNSVIIKSKSATSHIYKIRSYKKYNNEMIYSPSSSKLKITTNPDKITISKIVSIKNKITIKWNKVPRVTGYEIYSKDDTKFKVKKIVKKGTNTFIDYGLKNKRYSYKVRGYKTVDGKKTYGSFSSVKTKTIK
ncbi:CAP domain-containing protein [Methanobrevibacter filiformis]|uniref:Cysteine-rich secretory protein family protein n=1 Tax=Methanobrevibacter filiformis TaxID=55758 RepID=A0A166ADR7_9EURY|nr:CAP domain-containing protein [Methanobrevibacter filiformis]KZX11904.1 cysteine-rich secretory protein family protein [Methanobrevibacter filiformis]